MKLYSMSDMIALHIINYIHLNYLYRLR